MTVNVNEAHLSDTPYRNPLFDSNPPEMITYLTYESIASNTIGWTNNIFVADVYLSDVLYIRSRSVYDLITLIAEVSGFADIFFLSLTFVLGLLYTPRMLEASLLEHMGQSYQMPRLKPKKKDDKTTESKVADTPFPDSSEGLSVLKIKRILQ